MATLWRSILTPHVFWSGEEAREMGFPHLHYSWPSCKPWIEAIRKVCPNQHSRHLHQLCHAQQAMIHPMQACDPRDFLLFLPHLSSILNDSAEYMHKCVWILETSEALEQVSVESSASQTQNASQKQAPQRAYRQRMVDVLEHSFREATASFECLQRRNAPVLVDVLGFIHEAVLALVRFHIIGRFS